MEETFFTAFAQAYAEFIEETDGYKLSESRKRQTKSHPFKAKTIKNIIKQK